VPAHFYAVFAEHEALIDISNVEILQGDLSKNQEKKAVLNSLL